MGTVKIGDTLYEPKRNGEYIEWEAHPEHSRDRFNIKDDTNITAGDVVGLSGGLLVHTEDADAPTEPVGIAFSSEKVIAGDTTQHMAVSVRACNVRAEEINWGDMSVADVVTATEYLKSKTIILR